MGCRGSESQPSAWGGLGHLPWQRHGGWEGLQRWRTLLDHSRGELDSPRALFPWTLVDLAHQLESLPFQVLASGRHPLLHQCPQGVDLLMEIKGELQNPEEVSPWRINRLLDELLFLLYRSQRVEPSLSSNPSLWSDRMRSLVGEKLDRPWSLRNPRQGASKQPLPSQPKPEGRNRLLLHGALEFVASAPRPNPAERIPTEHDPDRTVLRIQHQPILFLRLSKMGGRSPRAYRKETLPSITLFFESALMPSTL